MVDAYILIQTEIQQQGNVANGVREIPGVGTVDVVTGPYNVIARVSADDNDALGRLILGRIQHVNRVIRTLTCTVVHVGDE